MGSKFFTMVGGGAGGEGIKLESRLEDVEQNKADKQEVAAVWDSMAVAYQEGVQEA